MDLTLALLAALEIPESFRQLPPAAHLLAAGGVIVGLVLWAAGEKILRLIFAAFGAIIGAGVGFFLLPIIAPATVAGFPSPHVGLAAGGLLGLLLGILLYRFAVAILLAGGLGVAAVLIAAASVQFQPMPDAENLRRDYADLYTPLQMPLPEHEGPASESVLPEPEGDDLAEVDTPEERDRLAQVMEGVGPVADRVRIFLRARAEEFGESWSELSSRQQAIVMSSAVAGLATGFILGFFFPGRSSAGATAMAGAAVWLPCTAWLWQKMEAPGAEHLLTLSPATWLAIWGGATIIGFGIQSGGSFRLRRKRS